MRRVALILVLAATVCGSGGAQPLAAGCCPYLKSFPAEWSADGSRLFFWSNLAAHREGVERYDRFVINADGSGLEQVLPERPDGEYLRTPDGRRVAFIARDGVLYAIDENGTERDVIATGVTRDGSVSPDGRRYAYSVGVSFKSGYISIVELPGGQTRGIDSGFHPLFSPDGSKLAAEDHDAVHVYDAETGKRIFSSYCCYDADRPVFSPDGTRAAFSAASLARGDDASDLYVVDLRTGRSAQIGPGYNIDSWSPDGSRLAYNGRFGVETINSDGTGRRRFLDHVYDVRFFRTGRGMPSRSTFCVSETTSMSASPARGALSASHPPSARSPTRPASLVEAATIGSRGDLAARSLSGASATTGLPEVGATT